MPIIAILGLIFKHLPLVLAVFSGLSKFVTKFQPAPGVQIDEASLAKLIEEITEREVGRIVNEHKERIKVYVPSEEDKEREVRLDELEELLKRDQEEYEKRNPQP